MRECFKSCKRFFSCQRKDVTKGPEKELCDVSLLGTRVVTRGCPLYQIIQVDIFFYRLSSWSFYSKRGSLVASVSKRFCWSQVDKPCLSFAGSKNLSFNPFKIQNFGAHLHYIHCISNSMSSSTDLVLYCLDCVFRCLRAPRLSSHQLKSSVNDLSTKVRSLLFTSKRTW